MVDASTYFISITTEDVETDILWISRGTEKARWVPLPFDIHKELLEYFSHIGKSEYFFTSRTGRKLERTAINRIIWRNHKTMTPFELNVYYYNKLVENKELTKKEKLRRSGLARYNTLLQYDRR